MKLGDAETKKLTSGRLYFKKLGEDNWRDFGNVIDHKAEWSVTRQDHMKSDNGIKRIDLSLAKQINPKYMVTLDEHSPALIELITLGAAAADAVQGAGNTVAEQLTANSLKGRTYFAAKQGLSECTVKVAGVAKTLDVDYALDEGAGAVTILTDGAIADGSTVTIDYTAAAVTTTPYTAFQGELVPQGDLKIVEKDQFSSVPRQTTEFSGQVYVTNWGENNLEDYNKVQLELVPLTDPVVSIRQD